MKHIDFSQPAPEHNPFIVPDGYFNTFAQRMMFSIKQKEAFTKHEMPIIRWIPWLGAACCATLMLLFTHTRQTQTTHQPTTDTHVASTSTTDAANNADAAYDYYYNTDAKYWAYENNY